MTPEEKAIEIVDKFSNEILLTINGGKVAALIAVDECLKTCVYSMIYYWQEVKHEIEKL